jgi:PAS domain S-box-containing protein
MPRSLIEAARLHQVVDAVPHKVWLVRPDGVAIYYNKATLDYVGGPIEPDRISRDRQIVHPMDMPALNGARECAMAEGRDFNVEVRLRRKDGAWRWHRLDVSLLRNSERVDAWVVTATDFDDLMQALLTAEQAGADLRHAAEASRLGIYRFDLETREHVWSPELKAIFGLAPDAPTPHEILPLIHPDDRDRVRDVIQASFDPAGDGVFEDEHRIIRPDGRSVWILAKGRMSFAGVGPERKAKRGVGFVFDITDRKSWETAVAQSEERYRTLVESASDLITTIDLDGRITSINPVVERILGYSVEEMIGRRIGEFLSAEQMAMQEEVLQRKLDGAPFTQYELEIVPKGAQRPIILDVRSRLVMGGDGKPTAIHSISRDITERKEAEARQALLVRELQHRTRNMLAVIQSIARSTLTRSADLGSALETFIGRLHALAHAQDFVAAGPRGGVPLRQLVDAELAPFATRASVDGEPFVIGGGVAQTFALLIHELATNATKHGALSVPGGRIMIGWSVDRTQQDAELRFTWVERGGPPARPPEDTGLGTVLMSSFGKSELAFKQEGFEYAMTIPLAEIVRESD